MNEWMKEYGYVYYDINAWLWNDVRSVQVYEIEQVMNVIPMTILGFPNHPVLDCVMYKHVKFWCV